MLSEGLLAERSLQMSNQSYHCHAEVYTYSARSNRIMSRASDFVVLGLFLMLNGCFSSSAAESQDVNRFALSAAVDGSLFEGNLDSSLDVCMTSLSMAIIR
jgi:hypothetical protein